MRAPAGRGAAHPASAPAARAADDGMSTRAGGCDGCLLPDELSRHITPSAERRQQRQMASSGTCMACIRVHGAWQLVVATVVLLQFTSIGSACGEHDHRDAVALNKVISTQLHSSKRSQPQEAPARVSPRLQRPYLGSWEYSGCGNKPCPGGTTLDITPNPWTVKDYVVETQDGPPPWQTLIFTVRPMRETNAE